MPFMFKLARRLSVGRVMAVVGVAAALGCSKGELKEGFGPPDSNPDTAVVATVVVPDSVGILTTESVQFLAYGLTSAGDSAFAAVDWEASGGSVTQGGRFSSTEPGTFYVKARGRGNGWGPGGNRRSDSSRVDVSPAAPTLTGLEVTPPAVSMTPGEDQQFGATGRMSDGSSATVSVTWTATGGSVTNGGRYTAGSTSGTYRVVAQEASGFADTATVTISTVPPPPLVAVEVTPGSASLAGGATQQFVAIGRLGDGSTSSVTVTWSATGGTVTGSGLYTAGSTAGSNYRVIATGPGGLADTASVSITVPPTLTGLLVTPTTTTLAPVWTQQFTATAQYSDGSSAAVAPTWSATGGTITAGGLYTAGSTGGTFRVIGSYQGRADTSTVTITPSTPTLTGLVVTPASASLSGGQTEQFSATAQYSDGSSSGVTATWSATGGTIGSGGLYTAGSTGGTFRVIGTYQGRADTSTVTITVPTPTLTAVVVAPASTTLTDGQTQQFSATAQYSDGSSNAVTATWSATGGTITGGGLYTAGSTDGSYRVIGSYQGFADTSDVTVTSGGGGGFLPPDIMSADFNNNNYGMLSNFPTARTIASTSGGMGGSRGVESRWGSSYPDFAPVWVNIPNRTRAFFRVRFLLTAPQAGSPNMKYFRHSGGGNIGNAYLNDAWGWGWDAAGELAVGVALGIFEGPAPTWYTGTGRTVHLENAADNQWHTLEYEIDKSGSRWEIRFWIDGRPITMPAGDALAAGAYLFSASRWTAGVPGVTPSTLYATASGGSIGTEWNFHPEHSPPVVGSGSMFWDDIAVSTSRIGP